ncbi:hydrolase Nlp/P60 [Paenibacillaceae bacterium]|nr:hydrolase Nlp/P60 [Paenibacillaceae bacterium]
MKKMIAALAVSALLGVMIASVTNAASSHATIQSTVSFRDKPSTNSKVHHYLRQGEKVTVLEQVNAYWYKVRTSRNSTGYVSSNAKYISLASQNVGGGEKPGNNNSSSQTIEKVIKAGQSYLGTPYQYGANRSSTKVFDCSSFVRRAFMDGAGITLPADSRQQGAYVKKKGTTSSNWKNLKRGDVMFFMSYKGTKASAYNGINKSKATITHTGIYLGDGKVLHTYSKDSGGVRVDSIAGKHWEYRFLFGGSAI